MEVCVDSILSALNAYRGGSRRLELCSSLSVGGLTPSIGLAIVARELLPQDCELFVMIRPRAGDFTYDASEIAVMNEDVRAFRKLARVDGFAFGCLTAEREVDVPACEQLLREASPLPCTFHRAFDSVKNPMESLKTIAGLGFARILTSGQKDTALAGKDLIRDLISACERDHLDVIVMPGGGVRRANVAEILEHTRAREFHGSGKCEATEIGVTLTDEENIREMIRIGNTFNCNIVKSA